jgi:polyphenol oxidase
VPASSHAKVKNRIDVLRAAPLSRVPWLVHGFSTRSGGMSNAYRSRDLNLGFTTDDSRATVERNRHAFVTELANAPGRRASARKAWAMSSLRQIHSDIIHCISDVPREPLTGDGLITRTPCLLLSVLTADCLPVILVDTKRHAVGVFHAGWRGTIQRIVEKGIGEMRRHFGSCPADLKAAIGPGIRGCCYQVGQEVRDKFDSQFGYTKELFRETKETNEIHERYPLLFLTSRAPGHSELPKQIFLDLAEANRRQIVTAGVPAPNISDLGLCTSCHLDQFFSHRAEKGRTGRMMAAVGIRATAAKLA